MPRYTLEELTEARKLAEKLQLRGCWDFCGRPIEEVQKACNGIGPECFTDSVRKLLDARHDTLKIAAMIHDVQYTYGKGTWDDFKQANANLYYNGCELAKYRYSWYNPLRLVVMHDAGKLANICEVFGWKSYLQAIEDRKAEEKSKDE